MTFIETRYLNDYSAYALSNEFIRDNISAIWANIGTFYILINSIILIACIIAIVIVATRNAHKSVLAYCGMLLFVTAVGPLIFATLKGQITSLEYMRAMDNDTDIYEGYYMAEGNITETHPPESLDYGAYQSGDFTEVTLDDGARIILETGDADLEAGMHVRAVTQPDTFTDPPYKLNTTIKADHFEILESEQSK